MLSLLLWDMFRVYHKLIITNKLTVESPKRKELFLMLQKYSNTEQEMKMNRMVKKGQTVEEIRNPSEHC